MEKSWYEIIGMGFFGIFLIGLITIVQTWIIWWGWNTFSHDLLGLPAIQEWFQAFAFSCIASAFAGHNYSSK